TWLEFRLFSSDLSYFGENQLSPSSFGISPLPTPHPSIFQHTRVRSSSAFYRTFNLDMGRSPGFGSTSTYYLALFRLAFATAPDFPRSEERRVGTEWLCIMWLV